MDIAAIITALGTIILGYFTYNQYTKNKTTDAKIEKMRLENERQKIVDEEKKARRNDNIMLIYGELWNVLYELDAARVYIIQPHPLGREEMLSIGFEVKRKGVEAMKGHVQNLNISDVACFSSRLVKEKFIHIDKIDEQIKDQKARSILSSFGCEEALMFKLTDGTHDWVGSIFCEFTRKMKKTEDFANDLLESTANKVQYILPEFKN